MRELSCSFRSTIAPLLTVAAITILIEAEARAGFSAPIALSATANDILVGGCSTHPIDVVWDNNNLPAVDLLASSINETDVTVTGPVGTLSVLSVLRVPDMDAPQITVTYTVEAPGGIWDIGDNGNYVVDINAGEVRIVPTDFFNDAQPGIASFNVNIVPEPASLALRVFGGLVLGARWGRRLDNNDSPSPFPFILTED